MIRSIFLLEAILIAESGILPCQNYVKYSKISSMTHETTYYYSCAWFGWSRCQKTKSMTVYQTIYYSQFECCSGYGGSNCLPICDTSCGTNMECSSPNTCTCMKGWSGSDCQTDIDECVDGSHHCEEGCNNIVGSYSCFCDGLNEVLANDEKRCLESVENFVATPGNDNLTLTWLPPRNDMDDGSISRYDIICISNSAKIKSPIINNVMYPITIATITSLASFTTYDCCIKPRWSTNGVGPNVCIEQTTLEDAPDDSPLNVTVIAADSASVLVQWSSPMKPNGIITQYIYLNYTNGTDTSTKTVNGNSTICLIGNLNVFQLVGVSISAITNGGEGPVSPYVYNRSGETEPGPVHFLKVDVLSNSSINVSWHPPFYITGLIKNYHLIVKNLTKNEFGIQVAEWILNTDDIHFKVEDLEPFVPYEISISATTKIGRGELVRKIFFTVESVPNVAPLWTSIKRYSASEAILEWHKLSLEEGRGYIEGYMIKYYELVLPSCAHVLSTFNMVEVNSNNKYSILTDLVPTGNYCISIAGLTKIGVGTFSQWTLVKAYEKKAMYFFIDGIHNCHLWIQQATQEKLNDLIRTVIDILQEACHCPITSDYVYSSTFLPCFEGLGVSKIITVIRINESYSNEWLFERINNWATMVPSVAMGGLELLIENVCEKPDCLVPTSVSSSIIVHTSVVLIQGSNDDHSVIIATSVVIGITFIIFATVSIFVCAVYPKRHRNRNGHDLHVHNPAALEADNVRNYEMARSSFE